MTAKEVWVKIYRDLELAADAAGKRWSAGSVDRKAWEGLEAAFKAAGAYVADNLPESATDPALVTQVADHETRIVECERQLDILDGEEETPDPGPGPGPSPGFTGIFPGYHFPDLHETGHELGDRPSKAEGKTAGLQVFNVWLGSGNIEDLKRARDGGYKLMLEFAAGVNGRTVDDVNRLAAWAVTPEGRSLLPYVYAMSIADEPDEHNAPGMAQLIRDVNARWESFIMTGAPAGTVLPPTVVIVTWPHKPEADQYIGPTSCKIVGINPYRLGNMPRFVEEVTAGRAKAGARPLLVNLPIWPNPSGDSPDHTQPEPAQVKLMADLAIEHGATDIGFYSVDTGVNAAFWAEFPQLLRDIRG